MRTFILWYMSVMCAFLGGYLLRNALDPLKKRLPDQGFKPVTGTRVCDACGYRVSVMYESYHQHGDNCPKSPPPTGVAQC